VLFAHWESRNSPPLGLLGERRKPRTPPRLINSPQRAHLTMPASNSGRPSPPGSVRLFIDALFGHVGRSWSMLPNRTPEVNPGGADGQPIPKNPAAKDGRVGSRWCEQPCLGACRRVLPGHGAGKPFASSTSALAAWRATGWSLTTERFPEEQPCGP
jgi:hypothetical protein